MKKNLFTSKANVLELLCDRLKFAKIETPFIFTVEKWDENENKILKQLNDFFNKSSVIIRSSAIGEDSIENSNAGNYLSIQNVQINSTVLKKGINKVIKSYKNKNSQNNQNQVLIQKQTRNVKTSGVIFTKTSDIGAPYYVINFEDGSKTDSVTSGSVGNTIMIFRKINEKKIPKKWYKLIKSVKEIESFFQNSSLDIEFALTKNQVIIFQVRPLTSINKKLINYSEIKFEKIIQKNKNNFEKIEKKHNLKNKLIFSDMTDWNPSEIIGDDPNPLDYSLYKKLIMKDAWTIGRSNLGYTKINSSLMTKFGNKPYVDVALSFNSLIPNSLNKNLQKKLIKFYLKKLKNNPHFHDKIEFDIVFTCYDFSVNNRLKELKKNGFTDKEIQIIKNELLILTNKIINNFPIISNKSKNMLDKMNRRRIILLKQTKYNEIDSIISTIEDLLDDCRKFGTIPFSTIARMAFIGSILLQTLNNEIKIKNFVIDRFLSSIETPLTEIRNDLHLLNNDQISKNNFLNKYGHLRPGTYDITAKRYYDEKEFLDNIKFLKPLKKSNYNLPKNKIQKFIDKSQLNFENISFIDFVHKSIAQREQIKFQFTKNLSYAIELIIKLGEKLNFSREEMAQLEINDILNCKQKTINQIKLELTKKIIISKNIRNTNKKIINPSLIFSKNDFEVIKFHGTKPNFISDKKLSADVITLTNSTNFHNIEGKIIIVENADPGFDWIFTKNPAGLITKYGGVASHMAIRCSELGLPAVIGCGELIFNNLKTSRKITIDCKLKKIMILQYENDNEFLEEKKVLRSLGYIK